MLLIGNADVSRVLAMGDTIDVLERSYRDLAAQEAVCRPRIDIRIPTRDAGKTYQWGTMEGGSTGGYFAIRMKSDVVHELRSGARVTREKYCREPGLYCGLVFLTSVETGEPLAILNDGVLQHMRVGADGAIGARHMAKRDARVLGMLGSGGMARSHVESLRCVRPIERLQVFSPTRENREAFAAEMRERHGLDVRACASPEEAYRGADIVAAVTDSAVPVLDGTRLEPGTHVINVGGGGRPDDATVARIDVYLRFGSAPPPLGLPELALDDEYVTWAARPDAAMRSSRGGARAHGAFLPERMVTLAELLAGRKPGRTSDDQVTYSERGNLQGAQFYAVAGHVYERARAAGLGREIPTEWFLQDIRD
ncbi:MAG TPA: ornithine cyclodeaminase family protein [Usitatibacter sp.]|jgi:ornithine cyclodeaminase/alanine dehydrogenase-like protein (mu-crystallin family)|nr:ornithine cyclodeaminase family protein [Usitatibacter sp.]